MITTDPTVHPWERAGLGKAPFRLIGEIDHDIREDGMRVLGERDGVRFETTPGGTCNYCGMAIQIMFRIRSADGRTFTVGSDCVEKLAAHNERIVRKVQAIVKARRAKMSKARAERRKAEEAERINRAAESLPAIRDRLAIQPHPKGLSWLTLADYCDWMLANAGHSGKLAVATIIEKNLTE